MKSNLAVRLVALGAIAALSLMTSPPAVALQPATSPPSEASTTAALTLTPTPSSAELKRDYMQLAAALLKGPAPRTLEQQSGDYKVIVFHLNGMDFGAAFYKNKPIVQISDSVTSGTITPQVSIGADWPYGPYVRLNSAEQAAAAAGGAAVIAAIICAGTAGTGCGIAAAAAAAIVGVLAANGICGGGRDLKVYWVIGLGKCV